ncbi:MAG: ABC transporter permease [Candidatus Thermoplasmatota archaeon]|jgi:ABC-2 type transport system permease protein|nr:ABC transporter permease [Candidatus Thermoplasmatota archaeon]MCL5789045.1 ABC transporter permease [Candidatus Thermoplasmatota archaeon]
MKRKVGSQIVASILVNSIYAMINYPVVLINTLLAPLAILAVVTFASKGTLLPVAAVGALIMNMVSSGTSLQQDLSHLKNDMRLQDMIVSSPTSSLVYVIGMAISEIVYSIPTIAFLIILNVIFVKVTLIGGVVLFLDMATIFTFSISLGFFLSTFTSDIIQSWGFSGILSPLLTTIPPVYYPITYIPFPYRYLAYLSPTTYASEIAQSQTGFYNLSASGFAIAWIVLLGITAALTFLALRRSRWREI